MKWLDRLLLLFLVSAPIHRIDFGAGKLGFILSPSLLMSIVIIGVCAIIFLNSASLKINTITFFFSSLLVILAVWFFITIIPYKDIMQVKRLVLFYIITAATISFFILFYNSSNKLIIISKYVKYTLFIYVGFSLIQIVYFILGWYGAHFKEAIPLFNLQPQTIGTFFPRLTGSLTDPSLGGFYLIFIYLIIKQFDIHTKYIYLITLLILITLSRSAIMTYLLIILIAKFWILLNSRIKFKIKLQVRTRTLKAMLVGSLSVLIATVLIFIYTNIGSQLLKGVEARLNNKDNSTSIHFALIETAFNGIFVNYHSFIKGYGFASSFLYTKEFFPENIKYGNFHSELLTIQFETGLIGSALYFLIILLPLYFHVESRNLTPNLYIILFTPAILLAGIFYQQYLFQYYWIMIGFTWFLPSLRETAVEKAKI